MILRPMVLFAVAALVATAGCGGGNSSNAPAATPQSAADSRSVIEAVTPLPNPPAGASAPQFSVLALTKTGETRVSRTVFDYSFNASGKNSSAAAVASWSAMLVSTPPGTIVQTGTFQFGPTAAGGVTTSINSIVLRIDRTIPWDPSALGWTFVAVPLDSDVGGSDLNGNGIRDDVESFINTKYAGNPSGIAAALQLAKFYQQSALSIGTINDRTASAANAIACLFDIFGDSSPQVVDQIQHAQINTSARARAYLNEQALAAGQIIPTPPSSRVPRSTCN